MTAPRAKRGRRRSVTTGAWSTPAQRQAQADTDRRRVAIARTWCVLLQCWRFCAKSRCRRVRACAGDVCACRDRRWSALPEDQRAGYRVLVRALSAKLTAKQALALANAEILRWREQQTRQAARLSAWEEPQRETPAPAPMPRIRRL